MAVYSPPTRNNVDVCPAHRPCLPASPNAEAEVTFELRPSVQIGRLGAVMAGDQVALSDIVDSSHISLQPVLKARGAIVSDGGCYCRRMWLQAVGL